MNATSSPRRVARNASALVVGAVVGQGCKGLVAVLVGRELGPAALGVFTFVWTLTSLVAHYAPMGADTLLVRELNRSRPRVGFRDALRVASGNNLLATAALVVGCVVLDVRGDILLVVLAAIPFALLTPAVLLLAARFHACERMEREAAAQIVEGVVSLVAAIVALVLDWGVVGVVAALSLGRAVNVVVAATLLRGVDEGDRVPAGRTSWRATLRLSLPMGGASVFTAIVARADIVVLGLLIAAEDVGIYSSAAIVVALLADTTTELNRAVYPALSRAEGPGGAMQRPLSDVWRVQVLLTVTAAAGLSVLASPIVVLVYGGEFAAAGPVLAVLAWLLPLRTLSHLGGMGLYAADRAGRRTRATGVAAALNLAANAALVPVIGLWGAVYASLLTDVVLLALTRRYAVGFRPPPATGVPVAAGVAISVAGVAWLVPGHVLVRVAAGALVFVGLVLAAPTGRARLGHLRREGVR